MGVLESALDYARAGLSVFPVRPGRKGPRGPWKEFQERQASDDQIHKWFEIKERRGICIIAGEVSGGTDGNGVVCGLEFLDCDDVEIAARFDKVAEETGLQGLIERLPMEITPRGGRHWAWRCEVWEGSLKLAERDISKGTVKRITTLIETKGEGGACTVAPTPTGINPDNPKRAYEIQRGSWTAIPVISPQEREQILSLSRSFNEYVSPVRMRAKSTLQQGPTIQCERPGDRLNAEADHQWWESLLTRHGWRLVYHHGETDYWQRPGKEKRDKSISATYGACGAYFYVFSSNGSPFEPGVAYKPFAALSLLDYDGDFKACAKSLRPAPISTFHSNGQYPGSYQRESSIDAALQEAIEREETENGSSDSDGILSLQELYRQFDVAEKTGRVKETKNNYELILRHHPEWNGRLQHNLLTDSVEFDGKPIRDVDSSRLASWAGEHYRFGGNNPSIRKEAILTVAFDRTYDPLQDFVESLPEWDRVERLPHWLSDCCGCEPSDYYAWVGEMFFIEMIARAIHPGCMARYALVLCGKQNKGKSELLRTIADPWYVSMHISMESKESHMLIRGAWLIELEELDSLKRTSMERVKSFLSAREDTFIPKYSNFKQSYERRCVFAGTTNKQEFLTDDTGNTRWFPVLIDGEIRTDLMLENRLQLFAEAKNKFSERQFNWWKIPQDIEEGLESMHNVTMETNPFVDELESWLNETGRQEVSWKEIAEQFFHIERKEWDNRMRQIQVSSALRIMGWRKGKRKRTNELGLVTPWYHPDVAT